MTGLSTVPRRPSLNRLSGTLLRSTLISRSPQVHCCLFAALSSNRPHSFYLVNPSFFYGPFAPGHKAPYEGTSLNVKSISTMGMFWGLLQPKGNPPPTIFTDVRDVARALVAGLHSPPTAQVGRKRIILASERFQPSELVELVVSQRPELAGRVNEALKAAPDNLKPVADLSRSKEVLGIEVTPWKKTVLDSVDAIVHLENEWKARGGL